MRGKHVAPDVPALTPEERREAMRYGQRVYSAFLMVRQQSLASAPILKDDAAVRIAVGRLRRPGSYGPTLTWEERIAIGDLPAL